MNKDKPLNTLTHTLQSLPSDEGQQDPDPDYLYVIN